jgi:hypothetical protein
MKFINKEGVVKVYRNAYIDKEVDDALKKAVKELKIRNVNQLITKVLERVSKDRELLKSILN